MYDNIACHILKAFMYFFIKHVTIYNNNNHFTEGPLYWRPRNSENKKPKL